MSKVTITGVVEKANKNARGFFSILVDGVWYGTYKTDNSQFEGQLVTFEAQQKGEWWNAGDLTAAGPAPAATPAASGAAQLAGGDRQASIVLQSSYKTAGDVLGSMLANDVLVVGTKKADKFDIVKGVLDELAFYIYTNCSDPGSFLQDMSGAPAEEEEGGSKFSHVSA